MLWHTNNPLFLIRDSAYPPLPLEPFAYSVVGRLSSLQEHNKWDVLNEGIQKLSVKTAIKKCQNLPLASPHPAGLVQSPDVSLAAQQLANLDSIAVNSENPEWLQEITAHMAAHPESECRYLRVADILHPNSISRFHFVIKKVKKPADVVHANAAANVIAPIEAECPYIYYIKDLNSLNGIYINDNKVRTKDWVKLINGSTLRFAPHTKNAKLYREYFQKLDRWGFTMKNLEEQSSKFFNALLTGQPGIAESIAKAPAPNHVLPVRPAAPVSQLSAKDMHLEYVFLDRMNEPAHARMLTLHEPPKITPAEEQAAIRAANVQQQQQLPVAVASSSHVHDAVMENTEPIYRKRPSCQISNSEQNDTEMPAAKRTYNPPAAAGASAIQIRNANPPSRVQPMRKAKLKDTEASTNAAAASSSSQQTPLDSIEEEFTCNICSVLIYRMAVLDCSHSFCKDCIDQWFEQNTDKICPVCRQAHIGSPRPVRSADNVIHVLVQSKLSAEDKIERNAKIALDDERIRIREEMRMKALQQDMSNIVPAAAQVAIINYSVDVTIDRKSACRCCCTLIEPGCIRLRRPAEAQPAAAASAIPVVNQESYHLACFWNDPNSILPSKISAELINFLQMILPNSTG
jgi:pSer/pThr/pTyr-binding forkhead associated (FHA) protein